MYNITVYIKHDDEPLLEVSYNIHYGTQGLKNAIEKLNPIAYPSYRIILKRIGEEDIDKRFGTHHDSMYRNKNGDTVNMSIKEAIRASIKSIKQYVYTITFSESSQIYEFYTNGNNLFFILRNDKESDDESDKESNEESYNDAENYYMNDKNLEIGIQGVALWIWTDNFRIYTFQEIKTAIQNAWDNVEHSTL